MPNPYFLMVLLYLSLAALTALDAALISLQILPMHNGMRWLRVHLITLGAITQAVFGVLPLLVAAHARGSRPRTRWDIWLTLNVGLLTLLIGIPLVNGVLIFSGGTLIFIATLMLLQQLWSMHPELPRLGARAGRPFYLAGLSYLLLGIVIGTGLWLGWGATLRMAMPIEVHIHANNWGFMALVFTGLLVDLYPKFANRPFAWPWSVRPIFWLMTLGAFGLVLGPWLQSTWVTAPGLIVHLTATIWLLLNVIRPLVGERGAWTAGMLHLTTSYAWMLLPVLVAPFVLLKVPGFSSAGIEQGAPQALIYGWVLQFGYAMLPYLFRLVFLPDAPARLGGTWFSLIAVHLGGVFLWASIFITPSYGLLHGTAYALWLLSALPIARELWSIMRTGLASLERTMPANAIGDRSQSSTHDQPMVS